MNLVTLVSLSWGIQVSPGIQVTLVSLSWGSQVSPGIQGSRVNLHVHTASDVSLLVELAMNVSLKLQRDFVVSCNIHRLRSLPQAVTLGIADVSKCRHSFVL